jgi:hypothetical protein
MQATIMMMAMATTVKITSHTRKAGYTSMNDDEVGDAVNDDGETRTIAPSEAGWATTPRRLRQAMRRGIQLLRQESYR